MMLCCEQEKITTVSMTAAVLALVVLVIQNSETEFWLLALSIPLSCDCRPCFDVSNGALPLIVLIDLISSLSASFSITPFHTLVWKKRSYSLQECVCAGWSCSASEWNQEAGLSSCYRRSLNTGLATDFRALINRFMAENCRGKALLCRIWACF